MIPLPLLIPILKSLVLTAVQNLILKLSERAFTDTVKALTKRLLIILRGNWRSLGLILIGLLLGISAAYLTGWTSKPSIEIRHESTIRAVPIYNSRYYLPPVACDSIDLPSRIGGLHITELSVIYAKAYLHIRECENSLYWAKGMLQRMNAGKGVQKN